MRNNRTSEIFSGVIGPSSGRTFSFLLVMVITLILGLSVPVLGADEGDNDEAADEETTIPFADAKMIFETNFTDGDTGIQIFLDGEPWKEVEIDDPNGEIFEVEGEANLESFGLTELFLESNEPNYTELPLADILALFPAGEYKFAGETVDGIDLEGTAVLTHLLPCGPEVRADVEGSDEVTISWTPVTEKIDPDTETCVADSLTIVGYQVIVEREEPQPLLVFSVDLPAEATSVTAPSEFLVEPGEYTFEVLAIEESGNQTITESDFQISEE